LFVIALNLLKKSLRLGGWEALQCFITLQNLNTCFCHILGEEITRTVFDVRQYVNLNYLYSSLKSRVTIIVPFYSEKVLIRKVVRALKLSKNDLSLYFSTFIGSRSSIGLIFRVPLTPLHNFVCRGTIVENHWLKPSFITVDAALGLTSNDNISQLCLIYCKWNFLVVIIRSV
jgi:hypothetical protein